eukprot:4561027-Amphidinium_carterae.3
MYVPLSQPVPCIELVWHTTGQSRSTRLLRQYEKCSCCVCPRRRKATHEQKTSTWHCSWIDPFLLRHVRFKGVPPPHRLVRPRPFQGSVNVASFASCFPVSFRLSIVDLLAMYELWYPKWDADSSRSGLKRCKVYVLAEPLRAEGPRIFWQLQELLGALLPQQVVPHRWFKQHGRLANPAVWSEEFQFQLDVDLVGSKKSQTARQPVDREGVWQPHLAVMSTKLMLVHLLQWPLRLSGARSAQAFKILADIVQKVLPCLYDELPHTWFTLPADVTCQCKDPRGAAPSGCKHMEPALLAHIRNGSVSLGDFPKFMSDVARDWDAACPRHRHFMARLVHLASSAMDHVFLHDDCPFDKEGFGQGSAVRGSKRRRSLDSDMMRAGVLSVLQQKRYRRASDMVNAGEGDFSHTEAKSVEARACLRYWARHLTAISSCRALTLGFDEKVLGTEKTCCGFLQSVEKGLACWIVPQVAWCKKRGSEKCKKLFLRNVTKRNILRHLGFYIS